MLPDTPHGFRNAKLVRQGSHALLSEPQRAGDFGPGISLEEEDARIYGDFAEGSGPTTPLTPPVFQVVVGGLFVFFTGILIGSS